MRRSDGPRRLSPPGVPGKYTDAATGEHGDLLDLIRIATGAASLRETLAEAHRFLAQPVPPKASDRDRYDRAEAARNLWRRCRPIEHTHAESYLHARAIRTCRFPALRFHPSLVYRHDTGRWRRFPALVAAVTDNEGHVEGVQRTWLDARDPTASIDPDGCADEKRMTHSGRQLFSSSVMFECATRAHCANP